MTSQFLCRWEVATAASPEERSHSGVRICARTVEAGPRGTAVTSPVGAGATAGAAAVDVSAQVFARSHQPAPSDRPSCEAGEGGRAELDALDVGRALSDIELGGVPLLDVLDAVPAQPLVEFLQQPALDRHRAVLEVQLDEAAGETRRHQAV